MKKSRKLWMLPLVLLAFGAMRMPFERQLLIECRQARLIPRQMEVDTRDRIGQTFWLVSLGGMRTLVATFVNLHAHVCFEQQRWLDLKSSYEVIADLAPHTRYYWETGAWHMAYNAASYYLYHSDLHASRRRELWRAAIHDGRDFLERGIRNNPQDGKLHANLASLLRDPNKLPAFEDRDQTLLESSAAFARSASLGGRNPLRMKRFSFYTLAQVPGYEPQALELGRRLYAADARHHTPTLLVLLYVLENQANPQLDAEALALEIFGDAERAYRALKLHWLRNGRGYPVDGVAEGLVLLESRLGIPDSESVLKQEPDAPSEVEDWFETR
ncbi:MAG: hypothetical protein R3242_06365 [Akkermansiaceae bacterium]|nr:hypothetical protein [Akkermansiaceae bacterium]